MSKGYIDADGHVMDNLGNFELNEFIEAPFKIHNRYIAFRQTLPSLDGFHTPNGLPRNEGAFDPTVGPERWLEFLDKTGTEYTVLYPTHGLAYGQIVFPDWALAYAVERIGSEPFMFASDFSHEIAMDNCMEEIDEILERKDLKEEHKQAILGGNAKRYYRLK